MVIHVNGSVNFPLEWTVQAHLLWTIIAGHNYLAAAEGEKISDGRLRLMFFIRRMADGRNRRRSKHSVCAIVWCLQAVHMHSRILVTLSWGKPFPFLVLYRPNRPISSSHFAMAIGDVLRSRTAEISTMQKECKLTKFHTIHYVHNSKQRKTKEVEDFAG